MDAKKILEGLSITGHPAGLGGCRNGGQSLECCEYNITVFDEDSGESVHHVPGGIAKLHHCSLGESSSSVLVQLDGLEILSDDEWKLRMLLARIREGRERIYASYATSCLVDAGIFANRAREAARAGDPFAAVWSKCAAYFLADAVFALNTKRPSPAHMLEIARRLEKNGVNQTFSLVHQTLGTERASTSLLSRMAKSAMGFSDMVENNGHSAIIGKKYEYLVENSLLADCYFYLGYVTRNNVLRVKGTIHKNPEFIHVLKVALDIESDHLVVEGQARAILERTNELLAETKSRKQ